MSEVPFPQMPKNILARALPAGLASRREAFVLSTAGNDAVSLVRLADGTAAGQLLRKFSARHPGPERACASLWASRFLSLLVPPFLCSLVREGWCFSLLPLETFLEAEPKSGEPRTIVISGAGVPADPSQITETLDRLIHENLAPLAAALEREAELPQQVFWSNLASLIEHCISGMETEGLDKAIAEEILRWKSEAWIPSMEVGAFVRREQEGLSRRRRVCCLCFELSEALFCIDCPVPKERRRAGGTS